MAETLTETLPVADIVSRYRPESWGRGEDWQQHSARLAATEGDYMVALESAMRSAGGWLGGPVTVHDGVVQDGHHRLVIALRCGESRPVPVTVIQDRLLSRPEPEGGRGEGKR